MPYVQILGTLSHQPGTANVPIQVQGIGTTEIDFGGFTIPLQANGPISDISIQYTDPISETVKDVNLNNILVNPVSIPAHSSVTTHPDNFSNFIKNNLGNIWSNLGFYSPVLYSSNINSPSHNIINTPGLIITGSEVLKTNRPITISWGPNITAPTIDLGWFYVWYKKIICGPPFIYVYHVVRYSWSECP